MAGKRLRSVAWKSWHVFVGEGLAHLAKYDYASHQHVTVALMWHTMMRVSSVNALDVYEDNPSEQYIEMRHRPRTDTPIKKDGERRFR